MRCSCPGVTGVNGANRSLNMAEQGRQGPNGTCTARRRDTHCMSHSPGSSGHAARADSAFWGQNREKHKKCAFWGFPQVACLTQPVEWDMQRAAPGHTVHVPFRRGVKRGSWAPWPETAKICMSHAARENGTCSAPEIPENGKKADMQIQDSRRMGHATPRETPGGRRDTKKRPR